MTSLFTVIRGYTSQVSLFRYIYFYWQVTHHEYEVETTNVGTITKRKKTKSTVMFAVFIYTCSYDTEQVLLEEFVYEYLDFLTLFVGCG